MLIDIARKIHNHTHRPGACVYLFILCSLPLLRIDREHLSGHCIFYGILSGYMVVYKMMQLHLSFNLQEGLVLFCFPLLSFTVFFFFKLKFFGNLASKLIDAIFPTAFAHVLSLCYVLVLLTIFENFSLLYLLWSFVIRDLCYYCKKISR